MMTRLLEAPPVKRLALAVTAENAQVPENVKPAGIPETMFRPALVEDHVILFVMVVAPDPV